jgi:hypothetical protein
MHQDMVSDVLLENMSVAFDRLSDLLQVPGWGLSEVMLCDKIFAVVSQGSFEPDEICAHVLKELLH